MRNLTKQELKKIYRIVKAFKEGLIVNPSEDWELDYHDEPLVDKRGLNAILAKIEKLLPKEELEGTKKNLLRRKYGTFNNEIDTVVYRKIEEAFNSRRTLQIGYFSMDSAEVVKRKIDIYHKTMKYAIAYCHLRNAIRKFRTSRIVSARLTNKPYSVPENFDRKNY
jgi:predicted DNA-binding transcriptional regulator YafY